MTHATHQSLTFKPHEAAHFWAKVTKTDTCWLWTGAPNNTGYGTFAFARNGANTSTSAHRAAYILTSGQIEDGLHLDHLCQVRMCVNPEHLEPVTVAENQRRVSTRMTHCQYGHALDGENVRVYNSPSGWRRTCVKCKRRSWREAKARRRG